MPSSIISVTTSCATSTKRFSAGDMMSCSGSGKFQEKVSDPLVRKMLGSLGFEPAVIERAAYVVSHHHTYTDIDGIDYQILVEADFLVNLFEEDEPRSAVESVAQKIFKTETGRKLLEQMFLAPQQTEPKAVRR